MRTVLSRFSEEFVRSVQPLLDPLERTARGFAQASEALPGKEVLPDLRELRHQLEVLVEKVDEQNAYVLIFGPLKSGKSTLMNALSAAYVSEVSSLPAYPCMVYVSHAPQRRFEVTRYDGGSETLPDSNALKDHVQRAHGELVRALRAAEEGGQEFDPATHFPAAIRRIDVKVPARALVRSGAVLVDTPGLYSRMKFGYDRMTRDFRDAAASAIFVVKSDNLFLEQVFDEFNELLDLFSRIFLVVNVDSTKLDLGPDGELVPSLEQRNPARIVQAFENYAMSAPLKRAEEEGRLRIYPIDLLRAASRRLRRASGEDPEEDRPEVAEGLAPSAGDRTDFDTLLDDLTDFLNSTDYLVAFINDSLRRADTLLGELDQLLERDPVRRIGRELEEFWNDKVDAERRSQAVEKLSEFGWEAAFDDFEQKLSNLVRDRMRVTAERTSSALDEALEAWFQDESSLQTLVEDRLNPLFVQHHEALSRFVQETLQREASGVAGGIRVSPEVAEQLELAEIHADEFARKSLRAIRTAAPRPPVEAPLTTADVPVKKRWTDWLLMRRSSSIRRRLLGPQNRPSLRIPKAQKEARLGKEARAAMKQAIDRYKGEFFAATSDGIRESVLAQYASEMSRALREELDERREELVASLAELERRLTEHGAMQEELDGLRTLAADARRTAAELAQLNGEVEKELVPQPPPPPGDAERDAEPDEAPAPEPAPAAEDEAPAGPAPRPGEPGTPLS